MGVPKRQMIFLLWVQWKMLLQKQSAAGMTRVNIFFFTALVQAWSQKMPMISALKGYSARRQQIARFLLLLSKGLDTITASSLTREGPQPIRG
nr:hypothetical protein [Cronobacter muytjensii]